ncbi:MAG: hypothetical protein ACXWLZ_10075, partial [Rhizomicrobium sp.]
QRRGGLARIGAKQGDELRIGVTHAAEPLIRRNNLRFAGSDCKISQIAASRPPSAKAIVSPE